MTDSKYSLDKPPREHEVYFTFEGLFHGHRVTWHIHLLSCRIHPDRENDRSKSVRQFIDVSQDAHSGHYRAQVCLNVPRISHATILKTMIMLQQYKNLKTGRHEYGEEIQLSDSAEK